ncbi:MFS transporter [Burkholderia pseudomultivorans]|uniref:Inner membrane metabolite transport protein YhjE n=1 Tax=Burkholderia pseudomultivorans TaxID=1207504 RepID=A0ABU2EC91_9BURK|nr:MFS transporter [Burkholderia pseudomultivorans]MDR8725937.1 Inner membrane metabolite transport protein YhjE [Burkholderia pseudomultivorans]MDR8735166.1 Inner membrane metabolite transport protein YhjE [Burkholderia pseudomultivorans]MDR8741013.1 Inner membrane metabolite transport protein YhjE [Burkholderia pseudomultivorans]MDR8757128.1 Inner membrane metabolite transport protein YhjE [Burkholderia pseudomultivorans]MDR8777546.1 Inner membrane metabolite transport protein YhjE [Burkhold
MSSNNEDRAVKVAVASMIGSAVESYDFFIYGTAAAAWFGKIFFHTTEPIVGILASFATLAIGFLMRPFGGYLAGHYGDRLGRKAVLFWSLVAMGGATVLIGCLPTYAQAGVLAPILLILLRMVQGIGFGAEWGGAVLMACEHAPEKRRGLFGAVPQLGIPLGLLLANGAFLLSAALFEGDWIWRMPFLMSFVMVAIGIFIRMSVSESPAFEAVKAENKVVRQPALEVIRSDWRSILKIVGLRMAETGGYYITTSFMLSYVALAHVSTTRHILWGTLLGSALGLVSHLVYGALSDKVGRRPVFMTGALFTIAFGVPMFMLINTGAIVMVIVAVALSLLFSHDPIFAVEASWFSEQFPANVRSSGISLGYNGASVIAGLLPIVATGMYGAFGWIGPALMFSLLGVISACCALAMKETAPAVLEKRNLRQSAASRFAA